MTPTSRSWAQHLAVRALERYAPAPDVWGALDLLAAGDLRCAVLSLPHLLGQVRS